MNPSSSLRPPVSNEGGTTTGGAPSRSPATNISLSADADGVAPAGAAAPSDGNSTVHHSEDRLSRAWRGIASTVVVAAGKAEKVASAASAGPGNPDAKQQQQAAFKELDESVVAMFRNRVDYMRLISYLEAKLQGREEEMATLQHYHASHAKLGIRTRNPSPQNGTTHEPAAEH